MNKLNGNILFAGGGTGGHIYPALATIEALREKGEFDILYVGGYRGLENKIVPENGIPFKKIWISGFQRFFTIKNAIFPVKLMVSLLQSWKILRQFKPLVVVGTGGYVSGPVVWLAARRGTPTLIQEQDSFPGVTTRLLAKFANVICVPYESVEGHLSKIAGKLLVAGNPVRKSLQLVDKKTAAKEWNLDPDRPVIFIFGGSQGAQSINEAIASLVTGFSGKYGAQVLWQVGSNNYERMKSSAVAGHPDVRILGYINSMNLAYSAADVIVSRAGAIALAELSHVGKPCVLVPYPFAAANHQEHNARTISEAGAALLVKEGERFVERLKEAVESILDDQEYAEKLAASWEKVRKLNAAETIAAEIIDLMQKAKDDSFRKN